MNFVLKPPGPVLRRLILKKVYDKIKTVICKQTTLRKAYLYIGNKDMFLEGSNINQNEEQISDKIFMYYIDFRYSSVKSGGCNGRQ